MLDKIVKEKVSVVQDDVNLTTLINKVAEVDDDSILICNLSDVIRKHENWIAKMPRVIPHYGK